MRSVGRRSASAVLGWVRTPRKAAGTPTTTSPNNLKSPIRAANRSFSSGTVVTLSDGTTHPRGSSRNNTASARINEYSTRVAGGGTLSSLRIRISSTMWDQGYGMAKRYHSSSAAPASSRQDNSNSSTSTTGTTSTGTPIQETEDPYHMEEVKHSDSPKRFITDFGIPTLLPQWKRMFATDTLFTDISAGLTVGCIAVPLSLAIALASGVPAEVGLVTAAVSGVAGGLFGGTTLAITGPAAAISLLIVEAVNAHGLEALPLITLACGGLQLASGVTRLGVIGKLVPVSVIAGFTTGVGTLILTGQLPKALGMHAPAGLNPLDLLAFIGTNLTDVSPAATALALGTSAAMYALPKIHPKIPAALLAVGGATAATHTLGLDVTLIGTIPSGLEAFQMAMPVMPPVEAWPSLSGTILLIYAMTSVESLLSCAALDKMKKTSMKYNADQELIGQGLANMGSAMFMGMPVTSVIARSGLNVRLNASSRLPALVQAGFVFSSVVFLSQSIAMIPMPALSGMLITTGMGMLYPAEFKHCYAVQKIDVVPFATTIGGMISFGLAEGIGLGCMSAIALSYIQAHSAEHARLKVFEEVPDFISLPTTSSSIGTDGQLPAGVARGFHHGTTNSAMNSGSAALPSAVWQLHGPVNFLSMFEIDDLVKRIERRHKDQEDSSIVLDMRNVTQLEFTGVEELVTRLLEMDAKVQMIQCSDDVVNALDQCDPRQKIARERMFVDAEFREKNE